MKQFFPDFQLNVALIMSSPVQSCSTSGGRVVLGAWWERNKDSKSPLLLAAYYGRADICELLVAAGFDVEERSPKTLATPLHKAARGHEMIVKLLLSHKADVNPRSKTESTPLHAASQEGHLASVVALLQAGADPLLPQHRGALPIHTAAQHNHSEVVRMLIKSTKCSPDQVRHITSLQCIDFVA